MTDQNTSRSWIIGGTVAAFVIVAAIAALFLSGGDGSASDEATADPLAAGISETRPVTANGTALPFLPEQGADPALGLTIPEVSGQSFDGTPIEIRNDGTPKIIMFLTHW